MSARSARTDRAHIIAGDATRPPRAALAWRGRVSRPALQAAGWPSPALTALAAAGWLTPDALVVIEVAAREDLPPTDGFAMIDERVYGAARLVFLRRERAATGEQR